MNRESRIPCSNSGRSEGQACATKCSVVFLLAARKSKCEGGALLVQQVTNKPLLLARLLDRCVRKGEQEAAQRDLVRIQGRKASVIPTMCVGLLDGTNGSHCLN